MPENIVAILPELWTATGQTALMLAGALLMTLVGIGLLGAALTA